ncbi:MAG TPA: ABC transporter ATP-binding protein [Bacteroidales bacterium]|nr:ABC transporter ATP-binding protein [Bacteroidales bacterium]
MQAPIISIVNLSKHYGKSRGIEDVTLEVQEGEIFGFIGPNGAGKSTTIRILMNLIFPDKGYAKILDLDVTKDKKKIMQLVGYVPADANAYNNLKVIDFLRYCGNFYRSVPVDDRIKELSGWFELDLTRKIADLSFGNRKKVAIIQSLLHRPRLLILDEPTTGLDPLMQSKFFELLRKENNNGMTIFFSSHLLNEVQRICKKVGIIKEGKIIGVEEIETLRKKQLKKITIEFGNNDIENFKLRGMEKILLKSEGVLSFMFSGDINELIKSLAVKKLSYMTIEEPTLEEIFMHYYR